MINLFLKAKHWQLFAVMVGIPVILQIAVISSIIQGMQGDSPMEEVNWMVMRFAPGVAIISTGLYFAWMWAVVVGLQDMIPTLARMSLLRFKIFFIIPIVYVVLFFVLFAAAGRGFFSGDEEPTGIFTIMMLLFPFHFFSMFCILYCIYYSAKVFRTAELQRPVAFAELAAEFFLILIYPVGIWIIQPRINSLVENQGTTQSRGV